MTSWIRTGLKKKVDDTVRPFMFQVGSGEFCEQFNQYFYTNMYAKSTGRPLVVYDQVSPVGASFALIKETFQQVDDTTFMDSMAVNVTKLNQHDSTRVIPYVNSLKREDIQVDAASILEWSPSMISQISKLRTQYNIPDLINVGVHINVNSTVRRVDPVAVVAGYIQVVRDLNTRLNTPEVLSVFVVAEQIELLQEFMKGAQSNWKIYTIPPINMTINGFSANTFERQQQRIKLQAYNEFICVLSCLQTSENLITSLSSEVGKFLFMTNTTMVSFRSMDTPTFVAR
jgi:hypothetical protein